MKARYKSFEKKFKTWYPGCEGFYFSPDDISLVPRASFEISQRCPENYRDLRQECINHGWLKPISHQPVHEVFLEELSK